MKNISPIDEAMSAISAAQRAADKAARHLTRIPAPGAKSVRKASRQLSRVQEQLTQALSSIDARRELESLRTQVKSAETEIARLTQALRRSADTESDSTEGRDPEPSESSVDIPATKRSSPAKRTTATARTAPSAAKKTSPVKRTTATARTAPSAAKKTSPAKKSTAASPQATAKKSATPRRSPSANRSTGSSEQPRTQP